MLKHLENLQISDKLITTREKVMKKAIFTMMITPQTMKTLWITTSMQKNM